MVVYAAIDALTCTPLQKGADIQARSVVSEIARRSELGDDGQEDMPRTESVREPTVSGTIGRR